jgi:hypothetical protein
MEHPTRRWHTPKAKSLTDTFLQRAEASLLLIARICEEPSSIQIQQEQCIMARTTVARVIWCLNRRSRESARRREMSRFFRGKGCVYHGKAGGNTACFRGNLSTRPKPQQAPPAIPTGPSELPQAESLRKSRDPFTYPKTIIMKTAS